MSKSKRPTGRALIYAKMIDAERKAPKPRPRRPWTAERAEQLDAARPAKEDRMERLASAPRCQAVSRRTGKPCRQPALKGATRCKSHGGRLEVPDHPSNIRRIRDGSFAAYLAERRAWADLKAASKEERDAVEGACPPAVRSARIRMAGVEAYRAAHHDGGRAWRNWLNSLQPLRKGGIAQ